jgi:hypothetical protein
LHCSGLTFFLEDGEGWPGVIKLSTVQLSRGKCVFSKFAIFCGGEPRMSSTPGAAGQRLRGQKLAPNAPVL